MAGGIRGGRGDQVIGGFEPKLGADCTSILCLTSKYIDNIVNVTLSIIIWINENGGLIVVVVCIMHIYKANPTRSSSKFCSGENYKC